MITLSTTLTIAWYICLAGMVFCTFVSRRYARRGLNQLAKVMKDSPEQPMLMKLLLPEKYNEPITASLDSYQLALKWIGRAALWLFLVTIVSAAEQFNDLYQESKKVQPKTTILTKPYEYTIYNCTRSECIIHFSYRSNNVSEFKEI